MFEHNTAANLLPAEAEFAPVAAFSCPVKDQHQGRGLLPQMPLFALSLDATQLLLFLNILAGVLSGGESCTFACQQGCVTEP